MERRKFILTSALAAATTLPVIALGKHKKPRNPKQGKGFLVKSKESRFGEKTVLNKSPNDIKVSTKDTDGNLTVFEYTGNEKAGPQLHYHLYLDEVFYIVEGEYIIQVGDEKFNTKSGDTVFAPRQVPHTWLQTSDKGKMFYLFQPSGKMEEFLRKVAVFKSESKPEEVAKLFADHDMKVVGPPLQLL